MMTTFYRIVQQRWVATAVEGEGARLYGGRWNSPGTPAVYLAESRALAALEILVHAPREAMQMKWSLIEVKIPDAQIEPTELSKLPNDWLALPSSVGARHFGESWLQSEALALKLPSVLIPEESTVLLNPRSRWISNIKVSAPKAFRFDPRF